MLNTIWISSAVSIILGLIADRVGGLFGMRSTIGLSTYLGTFLPAIIISFDLFRRYANDASARLYVRSLSVIAVAFLAVAALLVWFEYTGDMASYDAWVMWWFFASIPLSVGLGVTYAAITILMRRNYLAVASGKQVANGLFWWGLGGFILASPHLMAFFFSQWYYYALPAFVIAYFGRGFLK
jgi:hypothetical protein